jgi:hypothetical protein
MKRAWMMFCLGALLSGLVAFGTAYKLVCWHAENGHAGGLPDAASLARTLDLDADQREALAILQAEWAPALRRECARSCKARRTVAAVIAEPEVDDDRLDALIKELCCAYESGERVTLAHIRAVRDLLTPSQRDAFDAMLSRCLCESCEGGSHVALTSP